MGIYRGIRDQNHPKPVKLRRSAALYAIVVGLAMMGIWIMLLVTRQDAQLQTELQTIPFSISMAIASDIITAVALLVSGVGLFCHSRWAIKTFLFAMGFLFYSILTAVGLYGQRGDIPFLVLFAVILLLGVWLTTAAFGRQVRE